MSFGTLFSVTTSDDWQAYEEVYFTSRGEADAYARWCRSEDDSGNYKYTVDEVRIFTTCESAIKYVHRKEV